MQGVKLMMNYNEYVVYGLEKNEINPCFEIILAEKIPTLVHAEQIKEKAIQKGFKNCRIAKVNLLEKPDFTKVFN